MSQLQESQSNQSTYFPNFFLRHNQINTNNLEYNIGENSQQHVICNSQNEKNVTQYSNMRGIDFNNDVGIQCQDSKDKVEIQQQFKNQEESKHTSSYRFKFYQISNKKYRLVSLMDQQEDNQNQIPQEQVQRNNRMGQNNNGNNNDFRQPNNNDLHERGNLLNRRIGNQLNFLHRNWVRHRRESRLNKNKRKYQHSIFTYFKTLYHYITSVQLSTFLQYVPFYTPNPTLQSKYKFISLAILNNSINLEASIIKALQYNIPLMQIIINSSNPIQENIVLEKLLKNFTIAHFINQNFVLYGDWNYHIYKETFFKNFEEQGKNEQKLNKDQKCQLHLQDKELVQKEENEQTKEKVKIKNIKKSVYKKQDKFVEEGKIVFRKGENVFAQIDIGYAEMVDHNELQQKLLQIRDHYYKYKGEQSSMNEKRKEAEKSEQNKQNKISAGQQSGINNSCSQHNKVSNEGDKDSNSTKKRPKTLKEIEDQILRDYLEEKKGEEVMKRERMREKKQEPGQWENELDEEDEARGINDRQYELYQYQQRVNDSEEDNQNNHDGNQFNQDLPTD